MRVAIGADHNGLELKSIIIEFLKEKSIEYEDFGTTSPDPVDYPDIAKKVAKAVAQGKFSRGILICGTGLGMDIAANKVRGIRATVCHDLYSAERSRKSNNAQIMTMGAQIIGPELAKKLVEVWLNSEFEGGRSAPKVRKIMEIEKENFSRRKVTMSNKETPYRKVKKMLEEVVDTLREKKEYLNRLDAEIGDGDHGRTVFEVFEKALDKLNLEEKDSDIGTLLKDVGRTIAFSGGAATGPLFGTAFIEAGKAIEGRSEIKLEDWTRLVKAAEEGIKKRGRAQVGEKTMLDTVHSVSESLQKSIDQKESLEKALVNAEKAAREGMEFTRDMVSRRGRSSRLGERTKGHLDPGAASSYYILKSIIKDCLDL